MRSLRPRWSITVYCLIAAGLHQCTTARHVCRQPQQAASGTEHSDCMVTEGWYVKHHVLSAPPSTELHRKLYIGCQRITYNTAVPTFETRITVTPAYLSHLIRVNRVYQPERTLRSADSLLLSVRRKGLKHTHERLQVVPTGQLLGFNFVVNFVSRTWQVTRQIKSQLFSWQFDALIQLHSTTGPYFTYLLTYFLIYLSIYFNVTLSEIAWNDRSISLSSY